MSDRTAFDRRYWNLAQAAAWVEYRERRLVEEFVAADSEAYMALGMYPSMWPPGREKHGTVDELRRALEDGQLTSWGYRLTDPDHLTTIPAGEWADLVITPPVALVAGRSGRGRERWTNIRVRSADMKRLWRGPHEVSGRTKYDWAAIRTIYDEQRASNPDFRQNELIDEIQRVFEARFNRESPGRTTIQDHLKRWI